MVHSFSTFIIVFILGFLPHVFSLPSDLSTRGFEEFKKIAEEEVETQLVEEFKDKNDKINKLSEPFHVGDIVSITVIQGGRKRVVSGRFRGIKGNNAEIGDRMVLLSDIEQLDRDRLYFGGEIQLLQLKINELRKSLEEDKARRREVLMDQKYKEAGYTKRFFDTTIELGDRFWSLSQLGDKKIHLLADVGGHDEFINITVKHRYDIRTAYVVLMDEDPVYLFEPIMQTDAEDQRMRSERVSFRMFKEGMSESPFETVKDKMRIWMVHKDSGGWLLRPTLETQPEKARATGKAEYTFHIVRSSVRKYNQDLEQQFSEMQASSKTYQQRVQERIAEIEEKTKMEEDQRLKEKQEKEAEFAKQNKLKQMLEQRILDIEKQFRWFTKETSPRDLTTLKNVITLNTFDDINTPSLIDNRPVEKFTDWVKIPTTSRTLYGMRYRVIKMSGNELDNSFLLQYRASFVNPNFSVLEFVCSVAVKLSDGTDVVWNDTFQLPASWAGEFHGTHEITLDEIERGIETVVIERKVD